MNIDPEKTVSDYTEEEQAEIVAEVRSDFLAAEENRDEREETALKDLELYNRQRRDAAGQAAERGGHSKIEVPIVFWQIEHQVPRLGVQAPTIKVKAMRPDAVPYAMAKQMRLQFYLHRCGWELAYQLIIRSKLILGDGIAQVPWSVRNHMPGIQHVDWFDFFVSAEAMVFEQAECHFHRTFWTPRAIESLEGQHDENGPIWHNLEHLTTGRREQIDETWGRRRGMTDQGEGGVAEGHSGDVVPFISCWYETGEYVVLGGPDHSVLVRAGMSPYWRRVHRYGAESELQYLRPFVFFRNTPDLNGPYSISEARALEDHQLEMSTMRNQFIDQTTLDIHAPIVHDESIDDQKVEAAFSTPKGRLAVPWGPSGPLIMRMGPGQPSAGMPMIYEQVRNEAQLISGINDNAAGVPVNTEQTATEVSILAQEANRRMQLKRRMDEIAMAEVGRHFDWRDRQFGGILELEVPTGFDPSGLRGFKPAAPDQMDTLSMMAGRGPGVGPADRTGFMRVGPEVNAPGLEYDVEIDAGSAVRPEHGEEAQRLNAFLAGASHPMVAPLLDWQEITRTYISAHGFDPDKLIAPAPPPAPVGPDGQPVPPPPTNGAAPPPAAAPVQQ